MKERKKSRNSFEDSKQIIETRDKNECFLSKQVILDSYSTINYNNFYLKSKKNRIKSPLSMTLTPKE